MPSGKKMTVSITTCKANLIPHVIGISPLFSMTYLIVIVLKGCDMQTMNTTNPGLLGLLLSPLLSIVYSGMNLE